MSYTDITHRMTVHMDATAQAAKEATRAAARLRSAATEEAPAEPHAHRAYASAVHRTPVLREPTTRTSLPSHHHLQQYSHYSQEQRQALQHEEALRQAWRTTLTQRASAPRHRALGGTSPPAKSIGTLIHARAGGSSSEAQRTRVPFPQRGAGRLSYGRSPDMEIRASVRMTPIAKLATRDAEMIYQSARPMPAVEEQARELRVGIVLPQSHSLPSLPSHHRLMGQDGGGGVASGAAHSHSPGAPPPPPLQQAPQLQYPPSPHMSLSLPAADTILARAAVKRERTANRRAFELRWTGRAGLDGGESEETDEDEEAGQAAVAGRGLAGSGISAALASAAARSGGRAEGRRRSDYVYGYIETVDRTRPSLPELTQAFREELQKPIPGLRQRRGGAGGRKGPRKLPPAKALKMLRDAIRFSTTPLHEFMKAWDSDGSGELDFAEFCGAIGEIACKSGMSGAFFDVNKKELRALFDSFDKDEGGTISFGELLQTINEDLQVGAVAFKLNGRTEGRALRRADDDEAFNRLDADDSGLIDAGELISYYVSQGVDKDEAQLLLTHLDSNSDGKISRQEWREGLASAREMLQGKVKGSLLSSLVLESFVAPVKPPKTYAPRSCSCLPSRAHTSCVAAHLWLSL